MARGFYTYILECADGTLYTGWTTDIVQRIAQHNDGKGAKYTRARRPVQLKGYWSFEDRSEAMKFEYWLKKQSRTAKQQLLGDPDMHLPETSEAARPKPPRAPEHQYPDA